MQKIAGKLRLPFEGERVRLQQVNVIPHLFKLWSILEVPLIENKVSTKIAI